MFALKCGVVQFIVIRQQNSFFFDLFVMEGIDQKGYIPSLHDQMHLQMTREDKWSKSFIVDYMCKDFLDC